MEKKGMFPVGYVSDKGDYDYMETGNTEVDNKIKEFMEGVEMKEPGTSYVFDEAFQIVDVGSDSVKYLALQQSAQILTLFVFMPVTDEFLNLFEESKNE